MPAQSQSNYNAQFWGDFAVERLDIRMRKAQELLLTEPPGRILDIGCVRGEFLQNFIKKGWEAFGVELEETQAARAREAGVAAEACDISQGLPFEDESFDCVYSGEVIEHLVDTDFFISEINRVLKPGGCGLLTTPNLASLHNRACLLLNLYPVWMEYKMGGMGHVRLYTIPTLKEHLAAHGLRVERVRGNSIVFIPQRFLGNPDVPALRFLSDWFPTLATCMIVKFRKPNGV